jgi:hypothetical protein
MTLAILKKNMRIHRAVFLQAVTPNFGASHFVFDKA